MARYAHKNGPGAGGVPRPLVSELWLGGGLWGKVFQPRVLALGYEVGRLLAISLGLRRALRLGLPQ